MIRVPLPAIAAALMLALPAAAQPMPPPGAVARPAFVTAQVVSFTEVVRRYGAGFLLGFLCMLGAGELSGRWGRSELRLARAGMSRRRRHRQRRSLHHAAAEVMDALGDAVVVLNRSGRLRRMNRAAVSLLETADGDWRGRPLADFASLVDRDGIDLLATAAAQALPDGTHIRLVSGTSVAVSGSVLAGGSTLVLRPRPRSVSAQHASLDPLTGLLDRHGFEAELETVLAGPADAAHSLLHLDIDRFELVNAMCGHETADRFLVELAQRLRETVRQSDVLARVGGDEFVLLLRGSGASSAAVIAEKLRRMVHRQHFIWDQRRVQLAASIGVAACDAAGGDVRTVMDSARRACDLAKQGGRNRCYLYRPDDNRILAHERTMRWVSVVERALQDSRFRLHCQAIVPLNDVDAPVCYEILLRMVDEHGALVSPGEFIPAAERYQLMPRIDRWVVRNTLRFIADPANDLPPSTRFAINLSGQSLEDEGLAGYIVGEIRSSGVDPERLCFEITETAVVAHLERASSFILALRDLGCRFSLDDFGSGMSSFAYLRDLAVDYLKIDGRFVRRVIDNRHDCALVEAIQRMGQVMGMGVTAEFVESEALRERLAQMGVDFGQGYGIDRPRPVSDYLRRPRRVANS